MYSHIPVMLDEVIEYLNPHPGDNFVDCTLGGGGHTLEILKRVLPDGKVLGIDLDEAAIMAVKSKVSEAEVLKNNLILVQDNFVNLKKIADENKFYPVNGILLDLGISSAEFETSGKGFSFQKEEPLDMRFDEENKLTAEEIINDWPREKLIKIFREFGEEILAAKIADRIILLRKQGKIGTTKKLADLVFSVYKRVYKNKTFKKHPATKVFQALRIAVNNELENLNEVLLQAVEVLEKGGRIVVISFHSLEDRIVKHFFKQESQKCVCPKEFPICQCGHTAKIKILTKKIIFPSCEEIEFNPRSRSSKMRAAEKI